MVIETAVVAPLRLHIFGGLSKGAPPCGDLPLEKFQLPAAPLHPITAAIPFDCPALSQGEADLTEAEGLRKGDNFTLALVYPDTQKASKRRTTSRASFFSSSMSGRAI